MIPKTFKLAGMTWKVREVSNLSNLGETHRDKAIIHIRKEIETDTMKEMVFLHELVHAIKFSMGDSGPHDEKEVDGFAYLLHQYIVTAR